MTDRMTQLARAALDYHDRNTCQHETTHRGGFIWTICDDCGHKWADDEGGFVPYSDPPAIAELRAALDAFPTEPVGETVEVRAAVLTFSDDTSEPFTAGMQWDKEEKRWYLPWQPVESYVIAYISAHVELPTIPTLIARVET